jgi:uncharacterized membrane protein
VSLLPWLLYLHILGAIIAFGPGFALSIFGAAAGREPQHGNFVLRASSVVARRLILPLAILQGITGLGLVLIEGTELLTRPWLLLAIVLYAIALYVAIGLNLPNLRRLIEMTTPPAGGQPAGAPTGGPATAVPPTGAPPAGGPPAGAPPAGGPPPELMQRFQRARQYGMTMSGLVVAIVFLMVVKPF